MGEARDVGVRGFDLSGSVTYVDARTEGDAALPGAVGKRLPVGTIDISDAMNESTEPFFADDSHTNERANLPLSARMWKELTATIAGLVKRPVGVAGCS